MNVEIKIDHALKKYGSTVIIPDLSVVINRGEFFTLLGPSGCGKTTLLRMIAGFNTIEGGDFYFNDKRINNLDPSKRNIGMVFQNYAIFPHLTVKKNVSFGLKNRKLPKNVIDEKTMEFLSMMRILEYKDRMPEHLSGGQQQRVALARALAIEPDVLLMDEPLSNLDAKLRVEMRDAIKEIQNKLGITTVYVTHDQEEAMAISDRIAVMNAGVIQQLGTPKALYQSPANLFVATFIGRTNVLPAQIHEENNVKSLNFHGTLVPMNSILSEEAKHGDSVQVSVRPEEFVIADSDDQTQTGLEGTVEYSTFLGLNTHYYVRLPFGDKVEIVQESRIEDTIGKGSKVRLQVKVNKINVFTEDGSRSLINTRAKG